MARIPRLAKYIFLVFGIVLLAVLAYFAYGYHSLKLQSAAAARTRAELQPGFQAKLVQYQRDLAIGTPRSEIRKYLDARKLVYVEAPQKIMVVLGDEPDVFPCDSWRVYASLKFVSPEQSGSPQLLPQKQAQPNPLDRLVSVSLERVGHCL